jgi:Berberine and berberine like
VQADMNEPNFQSSFYGTGYQKLYAIKQKYDPTGVFYAKTAVGSENYLEMSDGRICSA